MVHCHQSSTLGDQGTLSSAPEGSGKAVSALQWIVGGLLRGYQLCISPLLPSACRFYPTCSEYMRQAVEKHGVLRGVWMGLRRLAKCHPFHEGGLDPVP